MAQPSLSRLAIVYPQNLAESVLFYAQVAYPFVLLVAFGITLGLHSILTSTTQEDVVRPDVTGPGGRPLPVTKRRRASVAASRAIAISQTARHVFQYGTAAVVVSFLANGINICLHATAGGWWCNDEQIVYVLGGLFLWLFLVITLVHWSDSPNVVHFVMWTLALLGDGIVLVASYFTFRGPHSVKEDAAAEESIVRYGPSKWDNADQVIEIVRIVLLFGMVFLYAVLRAGRSYHGCALKEEDRESTHYMNGETSPLLHANGNGNGYHTAPQQRKSNNRTDFSNGNGTAEGGGPLRDDHAAFYRPEKLPHKTWWEYLRGYSVFFPYLWPSGQLNLQLRVLVAFTVVIFQRAVNVLVPYALGLVVQALARAVSSGTYSVPSSQLIFFLALKALQGESGLLGCWRNTLWVPVQQYSYRVLATAAFEHVHSLSLDFHLGKRTGEVLSAMSKGTYINQFLEQMTFQVTPMLMDLIIAIFVFGFNFSAVYALFATIITFTYLTMTINMAATRADDRRLMVNCDREEEAIKNESISSYETVKYFNAEKYELERYVNAIKAYQKAEYKVTWGMNMMNICQALVFQTGLLAIMTLAAYEVAHGKRDVGDFVTITTYMNQLQGPLNFFGTFYRTVQQALVSGERLLELFKVKPTVVDREGVRPLQTCSGRIRWNRVRFWYDKRKPALNDLTFECLPGTTTAFVGESGGGKSTIFRLMFRYYNCHSGVIEIDGHDVKEVSIDSVRRHIGVVPQDTALFNESLMYNLKYGNPSVSDEEVYEACRAASIHDRIMSFQDGYDTKVGERGLRLSGGEKQRVAIARTMLKKPKIIMLDEATSALDSETEQQIQAELITGQLGKGRTLLIIAHRLSTITHADQIVVLHAGEIVERGTHSELLAAGGKYASMWEKQVRAERAAEEARVATRVAERLLRQARLPGGNHDEYPSDGDNSISSSVILQTMPSTPPPDTAMPGDNTTASNRNTI